MSTINVQIPTEIYSSQNHCYYYRYIGHKQSSSQPKCWNISVNFIQVAKHPICNGKYKHYVPVVCADTCIMHKGILWIFRIWTKKQPLKWNWFYYSIQRNAFSTNARQENWRRFKKTENLSNLDNMLTTACRQRSELNVTRLKNKYAIHMYSYTSTDLALQCDALFFVAPNQIVAKYFETGSRTLFQLPCCFEAFSIKAFAFCQSHSWLQRYLQTAFKHQNALEVQFPF